MPAKIFISYRRDDDPSAAARLRDGLAPRFHQANLFIDVDNLRAGQRFDEELAKALAACDVLIAIIGPRWMELLKAKIASGERDYVREEIAGALQRKIIVVPARVGREGQLPSLPRAEDLPEDIRELLLYHKHDVTHERFGRDIAELSEAIVSVRRSRRPQFAAPRVAWGWIGVTAGVLAIAYVAAYSVGVPVPWPRFISGPDQTEFAAEAQADEAQRKAQQEAAARAQADAEARRSAGEARNVLKPEAERALKPLASFRECAKDCPEMIVIPAGSFRMGATETNELPQHPVTIAKPFAVSKFDVTFADWDACVSMGGCPHTTDSGFGRGTRPVINVTWDDAQQYAAWFSKMTGQRYRLLTEAEWEYAARAGSTTDYFWGDGIGKGNANCNGCGSEWDKRQTSPVGSFKPNKFGLYDMVGNVWQWVQDCYHYDYKGAPTDGSEWTGGDCSRRVVRGGSWLNGPTHSASRHQFTSDYRNDYLGFRVGRTLTP